MGKNNNKDKDYEKSPLRSIADEQKKLEKKRKKIMIPCSHTSKKGNPKGKVNGSNFTCDLCGTTFNLSKVRIEELEEAVATLHNAINQIKMITDDATSDSAMIDVLGNTDFNNSEIVDLYRNVVGGGKKKNKNKNRDRRDDRGSNGGYTNGQSIDFVGGKKKKKYY